MTFLWAGWVYGESHLCNRLNTQNGQKKNNFYVKLYSIFLLYSTQNNSPETEDLLQRVYYFLQRTWQTSSTFALALTRVEREIGGPTAQLKKEIST